MNELRHKRIAEIVMEHGENSECLAEDIRKLIQSERVKAQEEVLEAFGRVMIRHQFSKSEYEFIINQTKVSMKNKKLKQSLDKGEELCRHRDTDHWCWTHGKYHAGEDKV